MLFVTPPPDTVEMAVIARIDEIRAQVRFALAEPKEWAGLFARLVVLAPPTEGSSNLQGLDDGIDDVGMVEGPSKDDRAFAGYRDAMQYILHLHDDPHVVYQEGFLRCLHFMMLAHEPRNRPGQWRQGLSSVRCGEANEIVYNAPPPDSVPELMRELMARLNEKDDMPAIVTAAMAHLNLVKIHPFSDGNGRMARALQTLVLVRAGILDPEFCNIEEYVRNNRSRYFDSLSAVGSMTWSPTWDARPFLRFCLTAHLQQAELVLGHARRMGEVWVEAEREIRERRLPDRLAFALADAAFVGEIGHAAYRQWAGGSGRRASQDLKALVDHGLLIRSGGRGPSYRAGPLAQEIRERVWAAYPPQPLLDPFGEQQPRTA